MSLTCRDIMLPKHVILRPTDTLQTAFGLIREHGMRFLPVVDDSGKYIGVFTSPTLIKLLLPSAITISLEARDDLGFNHMGFYNIQESDFHHSLGAIKDEEVQNHLSDPKNIPVAAPDTPAMEGILQLHKHKRHVILVEPDTEKFIGVLTINGIMDRVFDENHEI